MKLRLFTLFCLMAGFLLALKVELLSNEPVNYLSALDKNPVQPGQGVYTRKVTQHPQAQAQFDQGLNYLFAFNHDESCKAFERAAEFDPQCAMAYWGIAITQGSHINKPVVAAEQDKKALAALAKAQEHKVNCTPENAELINALAVRFQSNAPQDRSGLNCAYSNAMKKAWDKYPADADIGTLYAESMMNLRPWDLWSNTGEPRPETPEIIKVLETVLEKCPDHPMALHLYIHAVEASPEPGKAEKAAERLRFLTPGLGHLVHMPTHIDVRTGKWQKAIDSNQLAIAADANYRKQSPKQGFYNLYMAHNRHMLAFAAMMSGQSKLALETVRTMLAGVPHEWVAVKENAAIADGFLASPLEVMMRFGMWEEILKEPEAPALFPIARTMRHHARAVAYAGLGKIAEAREEQKKFLESAANTPKEATFGNNAANKLYAVATPMLEGEILYREGKLAEAIEQLKAAAQKEDLLQYNEPPDWIVPVRHPLGAMLLKDGKAAEAEATYREDLKRWPNNGWALHGLTKSLQAQGRQKEAEATEKQLNSVWQHADVPLSSSCKCVENK
ncbi:MAG: hypothetical protein JNJ77_06880 [Planctomycetia bacterium]|nr:hypothetical protein [Planctomycetia bacterium]